MKIGFDVDGVLANFSSAYEELIVEVTGRDLFPARHNPTSWDWDLDAGYTKEERRAAFNWICASTDFWAALGPLESTPILAGYIDCLEKNHDVYYITNRGGESAKVQTENWLVDWVYPLSPHSPTVLVTRDKVKGALCYALQLDVYIDDKWDNVVDCYRTSADTRTYLLDTPYNQTPASVNLHVASEVNRRRISSFAELFEREPALLNAPVPAQ